MTNEQTDWRALCAGLIQLDKEQPTEYSDWKKRWNAAVSRASAALAQPEPEGVTDEELDELWAEIDGGGAIWAWQPYARAVLARWGRPAIEPVPVAERLPGPEDCNGDGDCWWHDAHGWGWYMDSFQGNYSHWLPHHALPLPQS
jgi:hypothetical protein